MSAAQKSAPIVCYPWCTDGDGHGGEAHPDDQKCTAGYGEVVQSLAPKWQDAGSSWHPTTLEVMTYAGPSTPDQVIIYSVGQEIELRLRLSEALDLVSMLNEAVAALEGPGPSATKS